MIQFSKPEKYLAPEAIDFMIREILDARGNEVFFIGKAVSGETLSDVRVAARGNSFSVPAILKTVRTGDILIHNHPSGDLAPSDADMLVASASGERGAAFFIINNQVDNLYAVVPPFEEQRIVPLDADEVLSHLRPDSALSAYLKGYEERPEQLDMASNVCAAFNDEKIAIIEAGTGTGKSIAYLIPSVLWALKNSERVVISTNTINLQEQLILKDIPLIHRNVCKDFKAVLIKGRGNYACKRKASLLSSEGNYLFEDDAIAEERLILEWTEKTIEGSKAELDFLPRDDSWEKVSSEADLCPRTKCKFYNECFYYRARREAASSDILIANHHLLFADLAVKGESGGHSEGAVMPPYQRVIMDEAHNIEDVATEHFGDGDSKRGFILLAGRLIGKKDRKKGLLPFVHIKMIKRKGRLPGSFMQETSSYIGDELIPHVDSMRELATEFFDMVGYFALDVKKDPSDSDFLSGEKKLRITDEVKELSDWKELCEAALSVLHQTRICRKGLLKVIDALEELPEGDDRDDFSAQLMEFKAYSDRLQRFLGAIDLFFFHEAEGSVKSIDVSQRDRGLSVRFKISPVSIAEAMNSHVYDILKTAVLTSATLSVNNKFDYIRGRLGLKAEGERLTELMLESPFDFKRQAFIGIPTDMPLPTDKTYEKELEVIVGKSLKISGGSAFVLFTSYKLLNRLHSSLSSDRNLSSYDMMRQGEAPRTALLDRFRKVKSSVIFGSDSFWEGVDVPGDALSSVIVTKLPFSVPDDPLVEARCELITKEGGNPFMSYILPKAVLKFKQGFGRLIRNSSDIGAVLILDSRVVRKGYGNMFIRSLPKCNVNKAPAAEILNGMKVFLEQSGGVESG